MKIEVDTKNDSREELAALADMLRRLSSSSGSGAVVSHGSGSSGNIFDDPSPAGGMFSMFGDSPSQPQEAPSSQQSKSEPASGGLFSIFSQSTASSQQSSPSSSAGLSAAQLLSEDTGDDDIAPKSGVNDILDDDRIVPY
ncbi:hypothetical protein JW898_02890 [Candidatus Woesearchaeota archaeon]|nr:hypothetical protein [Candidatus Woesearchaeota archaeon]